LDHRRIVRSELTSVAVIAGGLGLFLGIARPGLGHPRASTLAWVILCAVVAVICATLALSARKGRPRHAAVLLALGSGTAFGYVAALTERTGHLLNAGVTHVLVSWEPYALLVGGAAALLLTQSAFNAGELRLSLPTLTVAQPLVAVAIGLAMFGENIDSSVIAAVFEVLGLAVVTAGVFAIGRSPGIAPESHAS
jgi:hypothetical protein